MPLCSIDDRAVIAIQSFNDVVHAVWVTDDQQQTHETLHFRWWSGREYTEFDKRRNSMKAMPTRIAGATVICVSPRLRHGEAEPGANQSKRWLNTHVVESAGPISRQNIETLVTPKVMIEPPSEFG